MEGKQKEYFDKALEDIRRFTNDELIEILTHGASCYGRGCGKCMAQETYNNSEHIQSCYVAIGAAGLELHRRLTENTAPKEPPAPQPTGDMLAFEKTINFMRERGHKRCYMCGTVLEGGANHEDG